MIRLIVLYGLVAGVIVGTSLTWHTMNRSLPSAFVGYLTMIIALTAVFLGVKQYRDKTLGGVIRFAQALLVGLGISAVASVVYAITWEVILAVSGFDFITFYSNAMIEAARARGASDAELQKTVADAASFAKMYANPLYRLPLTFIEMFPVGVLISLVSAALLRNSRLLPARARS